MNTHALRPWTEFVKLHPDVESRELIEAAFALVLGDIAAGADSVPPVYRDAEAFFRATYPTSDLRRLLDEVLRALASEAGVNRVLKLRTAFGGGKSHTLAALLHAARSRAALSVLAECAGFADPGPVAWAVFDGEKFDAREGKPVGEKQTVQTMWGWLAWQIDPAHAFPLVEGHDRDRVAPGGDVIARLLTEGAGGRPVLILLDEVLKYMERAAAVAVLDSTLQRQAKDFFQNLTVEVANSKNAVLVYSLTWSASEALGNMALLREIDHLAQRVDQTREPVTGEEVLPVIQRRLLDGPPPNEPAAATAKEYVAVVVGMRRAYAETKAEKRQAETDGEALRVRMQAAYPFHPALIDVMRERWAALDAFQRTRGALRFLATCLHSLKKNGGAGPVLGPGDVPLRDATVRRKLLSELGLQNDYDAVILADIDGPNARARQIDDALAQETPALAGARPATRLATAILLYSFGGLRRDGASEGETLPPGVTEAELLGACVGPALDNITAAGVLAQLRLRCLYLHFDGVRYCFKKDPNVNKLVEEAEQAVSREEIDAGKDEGPVRGRIKMMLEARLADHSATTVWPADSTGIPDNDPRFVVAYLPLEFAAEAKAGQEARGLELLSRYGDRPRNYRNAVGLVVPDKKQVEALRRATRYLIAVERVEKHKAVHRLTKEQLDELKERRRTEEAAAESSLRDLYTAVWLLRIDKAAGQGGGPVAVEKVEKGGRPLKATGIHERVMELLTAQGAPKVHSTVTPDKIIDRLKLGEALTPGEPPRLGVRASDIQDAFFCVLEPPRLLGANAIRAAIARGVSQSTLGYASGQAPTLGSDGRFQVSREKVSLGRSITEDEIDLDSGFVMLPAAVPAAAKPANTPEGGQGDDTPPLPVIPPGPGDGPKPLPPVQGKRTAVELVFDATRDQLYKAFPALANLADNSDGGKVSVRIEAHSAAGFDLAWLRNAVEEPLDEAEIERK